MKVVYLLLIFQIYKYKHDEDIVLMKTSSQQTICTHVFQNAIIIHSKVNLAINFAFLHMLIFAVQNDLLLTTLHRTKFKAGWINKN